MTILILSAIINKFIYTTVIKCKYNFESYFNNVYCKTSQIKNKCYVPVAFYFFMGAMCNFLTVYLSYHKRENIRRINSRQQVKINVYSHLVTSPYEQFTVNIKSSVANFRYRHAHPSMNTPSSSGKTPRHPS